MKALYIGMLPLVLLLITSCVDGITPDFELEEQDFISGLLTNEEGFVSVEIQKTVEVTDTTFNPVNDAQVSLFTRDASNTTSLVSDTFSIDNGQYTSFDTITPIIGNAYWIEVVLENQTRLRSEEEILKEPIPIIDMVKTNDLVRINFTGPLDEQNFYLFRVEVFRDGELVDDVLDIANDRAINEIEEKFIVIDMIRDGDTVRASINNINFNTFQFYDNILSNQGDEPEVFSLFAPINLVGNITNTTNNRLVLGNFGVSGLSTMTMDF